MIENYNKMATLLEFLTLLSYQMMTRVHNQSYRVLTRAYCFHISQEMNSYSTLPSVLFDE